MTILEHDIKLRAARVMDDEDNGGGGPSATIIPYGQTNGIFPDVTEQARAGGRVSIRQVHPNVVTNNAEPLMGVSCILCRLPTDPNVHITLAECDTFAVRSEIAQAIANYLIEGPEWSGFLLENHVANMASINVFHRLGTPAPPIGRTLVLHYTDGGSDVRTQFVRVTRTETEVRTFSYSVSGGYVDYQASVTRVDLSDRLRYGFPGSPPDRGYGRDPTKTIIRDTMVADAATYYGATALTAAATLGDTALSVASVYSQIVPSSRTETTAIDQRPAAARQITLADSPRLVQVPVAAHTQRIKIGQENRGNAYVRLLTPLPEPGSIVISYMALGNWYTLTDDGQGVLTGYGTGTVNYLTGSLAVTLQEQPDVGSAIIFQWAERAAYTNRAASGAHVRPPEYCWLLEHPGVVPGTVSITWESGGIVRTATDDGQGALAGDGAGVVDYTSGSVLLRPAYMPDAGGELEVDYDTDTLVTEMLTPSAPDAGGIVALTLAQQPVPRSLAISWVTSRQISTTSGGVETVGSTAKSRTTTSIEVPDYVASPATTDDTYRPPAAPLGWQPRPITAIHSD